MFKYFILPLKSKHTANTGLMLGLYFGVIIIADRYSLNARPNLNRVMYY